MPDYILVCSTTETREQAERIARALVDVRLAACVQIDGPITSIYRWEGAVAQGEEWRLTAKTRASLFDEVARVIRREHSYQLPEIIAVPITAGSANYLDWLATETHPAADKT